MQLIAHRGESADFPENTLAAFDAALATADALEMDLTVTRDGAVIVLHDETLDRTTSGAGPAIERDWSQIEGLDAGSWFAPRFAEQRIPRLEQVLDRYSGVIDLNLELKPEAYRLPEGRADLLDLVLDASRETTEGLLISSFEWRFLDACRRKAPEARLGVLQHRGDPREAIDRARALAAESVHLHHSLVDRDVARRVQDAGIRLLVYTVDDRRELERLLTLGVDGVFTNSTNSARRFLQTLDAQALDAQALDDPSCDLS